MRWPIGFVGAVLICGAVLADDARPLRVEAATLVQAAAKEVSAPERQKLLEQARGMLLEIRNRYPSESAKFQVYVGGSRTTFSPESLEAAILDLRLAGLDTAKIREILGRQLSATAVDEDGWTDLHYAAALNRPDLVAFLLDSGAKIDARGLGDEDRPSDRLRQFLTTLNDQRLFLDYFYRLGYEPLHIAAMFDAVDAARSLIARGADVDAESGAWKGTPLHEAAWTNAADVVLLLIEHGADIHAEDNSGWTPLHHASFGNSVDVVKVLIEHGADVHTEDNSGGTPLHVVAYENSVDAIEVLIEHGADVHAEDNSGGTPLHVVAYENSVDAIEVLIEHGADVHAEDTSGGTPLHSAARQNAVDAVKVLIEHDADVHAEDNSGETPLQAAIRNRHPSTASVLRKAGATR